MYRVFRVPAAQAARTDVVWKDDVVSRQSITVRDAKSLGMTGEDRFVLVEGSDAGVSRAADLLKDIAKALPSKEAERVYLQFRAQDEEAASGMGLIFGP